MNTCYYLEKYLMNIRKRTVFWLCAALLAVTGCTPYLVYKGLYLYELQFLPEARAPIQQHSIPPMILDMAWVRLHGTGVRRMVPLRFDHWVRSCMQSDLRRPIPISRTVADVAADTLIRNDPNRTPMRHAYSAAVMVWVSHHWSIDEALTTILVSSYYGHESWGIERAALTFFGKSLRHISVEEAAVLLAPLQVPAAYDPWCNPAQALDRVNTILAIVEESTPLEQLPESLLAVPPGACGNNLSKSD